MNNNAALMSNLLSMTAGGGIMGLLASAWMAPYDYIPFILTGASLGSAGAIVTRRQSPSKKMVDGRILVTEEQLSRQVQQQTETLWNLGTVPLPKSTIHQLLLGAPGSGKTQALMQQIHQLRQRSDVRVIILDRSGELLQRFYQPETDLLFNPSDQRSVGWSHTAELGYLPSLEVAESLIPLPEPTNQNEIFYHSAQHLLAALWQKSASNQEFWENLQLPLRDMAYLLQGLGTIRALEEPRLGHSVLFTLENQVRFYRNLPNLANPFSFYHYGKGDDRRWLFLPLLEEQVAEHKPLMSLAIDLMIKGILSRSDSSRPTLKTILVIDELAALQKLPALSRLLSEGRKYGGMALLGTQSDAQIEAVYGKETTRSLLQNIPTKLILNCPDPDTSHRMAEAIGKQRFWEPKVTHTSDHQRGDTSTTVGNELREQYVVQPQEIQMLSPSTGYLLLGENFPVASIRIPRQSFPQIQPRFIANH